VDYIAFICRLRKFKNRDRLLTPQIESIAISRKSGALHQSTQCDVPESYVIIPPADKGIMKAGITLKEVAK
jgi:hypothetical protein